MYASFKVKQQKQVRQLLCQEQCLDHVPYYLSELLHAQFFPTTFLEIAVYNKEHNGRLTDQETIVVQTYQVRWNAPNRRAVVQTRMQISKLQTLPPHKQRTNTSLSPSRRQKLHACRRFFFSSLFPFLLCLCVLFLKKKKKKTHTHTRLPPHRHRTVQNLAPNSQMKHKLNAPINVMLAGGGGGGQAGQRVGI